MATSQLHRTQNQTTGKNWAQIFPNEQVTEQKSCLFVKKLLAVAVSNITYLRAIFPEHAFGDKCLEDLNLKILRDESSCPGACQVIKWVKGCFDALDKKYLKTLIIGIYDDPNRPESMIESYSFKFTYNCDGEVDIYRNDKKISSAYSADATKTATIRLLRTLIILTNTLSSLPETVMMTMKLFYYDDVTPAEYEPPGFKASNDGVFSFDHETTNIAVGEVQTPFHTVKLRVKTAKDQFDMQQDALQEKEQDAEEIMRVSNEGLDYENSESIQHVQEISCEKPAPDTSDKNDKPVQAKQDTNSFSGVTSDKLPGCDSNEDNFSVRCPCGCNEDDGLMIMCSKCKFWQHGICFLITNEFKAPADHICDVCAQQYPHLEPTDCHLQGLTSIAVQATCLWRRALMACTEFKRIVAPQLAKRLGVENTVAQGLINRLEKEGFLNCSNRGKKLGKTVNKEKITSEGIPKYLKTPINLTNKISKDVDMDQDDDERPMKAANTKNETPVDALVNKTNKMDISGCGKKKPKQIEKNNQPPQEAKGRRGKKRAFSKADSTEFDVSNSQEHQSAKKKASTVHKDLTV